ncbi:MAG: hypothetical protein HGA59_09555 [Chlorobiaceae bacterium]|nr:hypothetical protein [Desulfobulbaceae bacterium]NTV06732.1 hypothetical protein [Chlorobiaceae bacterium]
MRWAVVFAPADRWVWFNLFTGRKYAHIFAMTEAAEGKIMVVDPLLTGLDVRIYDTGLAKEMREQIDHGRKIIVVDAPEERKPRLYGVYTCVTVIKSLLYVRAWWVITPKQLYNHLTRKQWAE